MRKTVLSNAKADYGSSGLRSSHTGTTQAKNRLLQTVRFDLLRRVGRLSTVFSG
jgi:hypothetical protein